MLETRQFTVSQVAQRLGVSPSTIKLWESNGYIKKARRAKLNRVRVYGETEIAEIESYLRENYGC